MIPRLRTAWPAALLAALLLSPACAVASGIDALVDRYIAWRGGERYLALHAVQREGALEAAGLRGRVAESFDREGRQRQDLDLGAIRTAKANDLAAGWTRNHSDQIEAMLPDQVATERRGRQLEFAQGARGDAGTRSLQPEEQLDGRTWAVLRIAHSEHERHELLLDPGTGALHAVRSVEDGRAHLTRLRDWREVDGVRFAFEQATESPLGDASTVRWERIVPLAALDAAALARPEAASKVRFAGAATSSGWLQFEFFRDRRIFIPARVNGRDTTVLLDSGAQSTVLDSAFAATIGVQREGNITALGAGGTQEAALLPGVDIALGALELAGITAVAIDLESTAAGLGHPLPVILGKEILNDTVVEIDFERRRIAFHAPAHFQAPAGFQAVPVVGGADGIRQIGISVEGAPPVWADFDLGNGSPLVLFPALWQQDGWLRDRLVAASLGGAVGGHREEQVTRLRSLGVGPFEFRDVPATLAPPGLTALDSTRTLGNLGLPVVTRFHTIIDYPHDRLLLKPASTFATPFARDRSGLAAMREGDALRIAFVAPGSPAAGDWAVGDEIVAVDGTPVAALQDPFGWREAAAGTTVRLGLRDGRIRTLTLADYY